MKLNIFLFISIIILIINLNNNNGGGALAAGVLSSGYKGPCFIQSSCISQCQKERYNSGHCSTWKLQCWCTQKCKNAITRVGGRFICQTRNG